MEDIFEELGAAVSDDEERLQDRNQEVKEDEAQEVNDESKKVVKPKRHISRPRLKLDPQRLLGSRGIFVLTSTFDGIHFRGKGHELNDLNNILSRLQHWAHRLFPKMTFEDCMDRIEELGQKREIQTNMHKIRMGMVDLNDDQQGVNNEGEPARPISPEPISTAESTFDTLVAATPQTRQTTLSEEQRARMMRNRLIAEERRMARKLARESELELQRQNVSNNSPPNSTPALAHGSETPKNSIEVETAVLQTAPNNFSIAGFSKDTSVACDSEVTHLVSPNQNDHFPMEGIEGEAEMHSSIDTTSKSVNGKCEDREQFTPCAPEIRTEFDSIDETTGAPSGEQFPSKSSIVNTACSEECEEMITDSASEPVLTTI